MALLFYYNSVLKECDYMKIETRRLLLNKYILVSFFVLFLIMFLSWGIDSGVFGVIINFGSYDGPYTLGEYLSLISGFESYAELGYRFVQLIMPVFPVIIIIPFLNDISTLPMVYPRAASYKKVIVPKIIKCLVVGCFALFLAFLCFLCIGLILLPAPQELGDYELFSEIFGKNFYEQHIEWFLVVQGFLRFFIFPFVYGLFGIAIAFLTPKKHLCLLIPVAYYTVLSLVVACLNSVFSPRDFFYFSPTYTLMSTARPYVNGFAVIAPLLPVFIFSIVVIATSLIKKRNRGDVLAAI